MPFHLRRPANVIIPSVCTCAHLAILRAEKERNKAITTGSQMSSISLALVRKGKQNLSRVHFIIIIIIIINYYYSNVQVTT